MFVMRVKFFEFLKPTHPHGKSIQFLIKSLSSNSAASTQKLSKSSSIKFCNHQETFTNKLKLNESARRSNRLVIMFAWIAAKEKYVEKYRQIYFKHGFDVLTVHTKPFDLILPPIGSRVIAQDLFNYLVSQENQYSDIVVHGFSVGAYQFGEFLIKLSKAVEGNDKSSRAQNIVSQIKGLIFDSAADVHAAPSGLSRSIAGDTSKADIIEALIKVYMKITYPISTRYYYEAATSFYGNFLRCPALLLFSHHDAIADAKSNFALAEKWTNRGIDVTMKDFDQSRHVTHLHRYPKEYENQIDTFLSRIKLD